VSSRWDPNSDRAAHEGALPGPSAFTLCGWLRILADVNDWRSLVRLSGAGGSPTLATLGTLADGTTLAYVSPGGTLTGAGYQLVPNAWVFAALRTGPTPGTGDLLIAEPGGALTSVVAGGAVTAGAASGMITFGGRSPSDATESYPVDLSYVRLFGARLSNAELDAERRSPVALHASIAGHWEALEGNSYADSSGNGRHLTPGATLTATASGPPLGPGVAAPLALGSSAEGGPAEIEGAGAADSLALDSSATGHKEADGATSVALVLDTTSGGHKIASADASAAPLTLGTSATGEPGTGGGEEPDVATAVSEVLCSPWARVIDVPERQLAELPDDITDAQIDEALLRASEVLWALSGRRWLGGGCEETAVLRSLPPAPGTASWPYETSWGRCRCWSFTGWHLADGLPVHAHPFPGRHEAPIAVKLPRSPVMTVTSVTVGGEPFAAWRLLSSGWLERTDGQAWNVCDGDTEIAYTFGEPPPGGGRDAAVELGLEILKYWHKLDSCRLPRKATNITRQGVSISIDPASFLTEGGTGLLGVDLWLRSVNPDRAAQAARVWSPDLPQTMRM
jgi:hypothetical protein